MWQCYGGKEGGKREKKKEEMCFGCTFFFFFSFLFLSFFYKRLTHAMLISAWIHAHNDVGLIAALAWGERSTDGRMRGLSTRRAITLSNTKRVPQQAKRYEQLVTVVTKLAAII